MKTKVEIIAYHETSTWLQGHVYTTYARLVEVLGEPVNDGDGYKTDAQWSLVFPDGVIATVYNWKNGRNYLGAEGDAVEDITEWNVGGTHQEVVDRVNELVRRPEQCAACDDDIVGFGNNGWPVVDDRVCDACNATKVIPARLDHLAATH